MSDTRKEKKGKENPKNYGAINLLKTSYESFSKIMN
jgi:hypothetical protein